MYTTHANRKSFTTLDGAELSYLEAGEGQTMVMVHGWSQSALQWYAQINEYSKSYRVIAIDQRGHGESSKVDYGYRLYKLAQDLRELSLGLDIKDAIYMGHSMGCAVLWAYWDLYGGDNISKLIFVDDGVYPSDNPTLTPEEKLQGGSVLVPEMVYNLAMGWANDTDGSFSREFFREQFTPNVPDELFEIALKHHMLLPRKYAAALMIDIVHQDLRDVLPRINVPALSIGGKSSLIPWQSIIWQGEQMPQGQSYVFETEEGGAHFMFIENIPKFNKLLTAFLNET